MVEGFSANHHPVDHHQGEPEKRLLENLGSDGESEACTDQDERVHQGVDLKRAAQSGEGGERNQRKIPPPFRPFPSQAHSGAEVAESLPIRDRLTSPVERLKRSAHASTRKGTTECSWRTSPTAASLLPFGMS